MEKQADISELVQLIYVGLIGANKRTEDTIKRFLDEQDMPIHSFLFLECLTHKPLPLSKKEEAGRMWEISPFINRLVRKSLVMIMPEDTKNDWKIFNPQKDKDILETTLIIKMERTMYTEFVYKYWAEIENLRKEVGKVESEFKYRSKIEKLKEKLKRESEDKLELIDFVENDEIFWFIRAKQCKKDVECIENIDKEEDPVGFGEKLRKADSISKKSFKMLYGLLWPQIQHLKEGTFFFIPIASNTIFYGVIFIGLPHLNYPDAETKLKKLVSMVFRHAKKHYVPALALIHEHFCEKLLSKDIKKFVCQRVLTDDEKINLLGKTYDLSLYDSESGEDLTEKHKEKIEYNGFVCLKPREVTICFECPYYGWEQASDNVVEKYLHKLWQDRKIIGDAEYIAKSLFFKERLYTDPEMLDLLEDFLKPSKSRLKKDREYLPSVLVEAPPGSGKGFMVNLFKIFSDCYNRGEMYRLNMASLKPNVFAPVAMMGGEITWEKSIYQEGKHQKDGLPRDLILIGILQQIRVRTYYAFQDFFSSLEEDGFIPQVHRYLLYINHAIWNAIGSPEDKGKIVKQLKKKREHLNKIIKALDELLEELIGQEQFEEKIDNLCLKEIQELEELKDIELEVLMDVKKKLNVLKKDIVLDIELKKGIDKKLGELKDINSKEEEIEKKLEVLKKDIELNRIVEKKIEKQKKSISQKNNTEQKLRVLKDIGEKLELLKGNNEEKLKKLENDGLIKVFGKKLELLNKEIEQKAEIEEKLEELKGISLNDIEKKINELSEIEKRLKNQKKEIEDDLKKCIVDKLKELKTLHEKLKEEFKKGANKFLKKLSPEEKLIIKELFGRFPTLMLDELNSLDIDSQGVLLRFLENAEIATIGGYEDKMWINGEIEKEYQEFLTDFLIVGLMNEDPEEITREKGIRFLKQKDSYISGLLGDLLYEHILRIRRLRPDLRQRMMRNGKFEVPELARHRADIPVIFYMEIDITKEEFFPNCVVRITMDALEYLMKPELEWPENVRLLQTLKQKVLEIVYEDYYGVKKEVEKIKRKIHGEVIEMDLIIIRTKHIEKAMKEISMIKE